MRDNRRQFLKMVSAAGTAALAGAPAGASQSRAEFAPPSNSSGSFAVEMTVDFGRFENRQRIFEIPNVLTVALHRHDPLDRNRQNYPAFRMPDGSVPVLEADLVLHSVEHPDWQNMAIGIPLAMLPHPAGEHQVVLNFTGVRWSMYVDGELLDNDFPFGYPQWGERNTWEADPRYVRKAAVHFPALAIPPKPAEKLIAGRMQYWMPHGHNNWVGDVVTFFHQGRYHVFYLYDRRHHQSKFGKGAHYFEHLSTKDFATWTEHEPATPIEEQWECIGTGTPFLFRDRLCLAYGLHTGRIYPDEKTTWPAQWEYLKKNGRTGSFPRATTPGIPAGATYSVSADAVSNFHKSNVTFHPCQNPSVYTDPEGRLRMLANAGSSGTWESESVDGGWRSIDAAFPPGGDCTFFFRWGKLDYIIGGFTGLWSKPADAPDSAYEDVVRKGLDFYDGCNVPSITQVAGGRFVMAAWIPIRGWGGTLILRELIQSPEGRIGSKWLQEAMPETEPPKALAWREAEAMTLPAQHESFLITFEVHPAEAHKGRLGIALLPESGEQDGCELQVGLDNGRAQFGPGFPDRFAESEKSLREGGAPAKVLNYAIENLMNVDRPFTIRLMILHGEKIGGCLLDAEIAGERTMISYRPDLAVKRLIFRAHAVELRNIRMAAIRPNAVRL